MAKKKSKARAANRGARSPEDRRGNGGELHQHSTGEALTTNQGVPIADDQNTLTAGPRGPQLLEDFILREKVTHFDHERIPERVVHARGYGAHGHFEAYEGNGELTKAAFLQAGERTPAFVRFSTVAGSLGSPDTARDVRGFAVKFYTREGNYDLVGNNIPVFFIQDAIKFPDLIHSVKPEPDREFPQAASAHDTFWDFVSLTPESMHMLLWVMSDRALPRSFRMMEGFGVHTFRMVNAKGQSTFVKFHWRPALGTFSLVWDEAVKLAGADLDFHRRDLWSAIERGDFPEWELSVQAFSESRAASFDFDVLDPTKLVPEELVPLRPLGRLVLDRNVDNFFAETEQVAFCPSHLVPGIDFSNDPLLQGRLFSYLDTQLSRLGSPNFHQLPINRPQSPSANFQRDAHLQFEVPKGRAAYEPNSLERSGPREDPQRGFTSVPAREEGQKLRIRPESFADHYTQARLFWSSMTEPERRHIVAAFGFELGKCDSQEIRERMLGHLSVVDGTLAAGVAKKLGLTGRIAPARPAVAPRSMPPSPALSQYAKAPASLQGRKLGLLVTEGFPSRLHNALRRAAKAEGAQLALIGPHPGPVPDDRGQEVVPDHFLDGAPSVLFDAVVVAPGAETAAELLGQAAAIDWVRDAYSHLKTIGCTEQGRELLDRAGLPDADDEGLVFLERGQVNEFIEQAKRHRHWARESRVRPE
jgi:catalase